MAKARYLEVALVLYFATDSETMTPSMWPVSNTILTGIEATVAAMNVCPSTKLIFTDALGVGHDLGAVPVVLASS